MERPGRHEHKCPRAALTAGGVTDFQGVDVKTVPEPVVSTRSDLTPTQIARFVAGSTPAPADECWPWLKARDSHGYGVVWLNGRRSGAHRVAFVIAKGEIPSGLVLDHLCRNRACVNPGHLEAVTTHENILRGEVGLARDAKPRKPRTVCLRGHALTPDNVVLISGFRNCATCRRASRLRERAKVVQRRRAAAAR